MTSRHRSTSRFGGSPDTHERYYYSDTNNDIDELDDDYDSLSDRSVWGTRGMYEDPSGILGRGPGGYPTFAGVPFILPGGVGERHSGRMGPHGLLGGRFGREMHPGRMPPGMMGRTPYSGYGDIPPSMGARRRGPFRGYIGPEAYVMMAFHHESGFIAQTKMRRSYLARCLTGCLSLNIFGGTSVAGSLRTGVLVSGAIEIDAESMIEKMTATKTKTADQDVVEGKILDLASLQIVVNKTHHKGGLESLVLDLILAPGKEMLALRTHKVEVKLAKLLGPLPETRKLDRAQVVEQKPKVLDLELALIHGMAPLLVENPVGGTVDLVSIMTEC